MNARKIPLRSPFASPHVDLLPSFAKVEASADGLGLGGPPSPLVILGFACGFEPYRHGSMAHRGASAVAHRFKTCSTRTSAPPCHHTAPCACTSSTQDRTCSDTRSGAKARHRPASGHHHRARTHPFGTDRITTVGALSRASASDHANPKPGDRSATPSSSTCRSAHCRGLEHPPM